MDILVLLPVSHINQWTLERENVIDISSISFKSIYDEHQIDVEWSQNNTILNLHTESSNVVFNREVSVNDLMDNQIHRSFEGSYFNPYLQRIIEQTKQSTLNHTHITDLNKEDTLSKNDRILANLPSNRTIYFNCKGSRRQYCIMGKFTVSNLKASNLPVLIRLNFSIDMTKIAKFMSGKMDIFVIQTFVEPMHISDKES